MEREKKKNKLWILWIILAVILLFAFTAWGILIHKVIEYREEAATAEERPTQEDRRKEEVLAYLEERYGEEFEIASYRGRGYAYDYVQMYAYPKGYEDEAHKFEIQGRINEEGKMEYVDSYVMIRLTDEYETYVGPIIEKYYNQYKYYVRFDSEWMISNLSVDIKVEDLKNLRANQDYPLPTIYLFLGPDCNSSKKCLEDFIKELSNNDIHCGGGVAYYNDIQMFENLGDNWNDNVKSVDLKDIDTYLIYGKNNYELFTNGGN